MAIATSTPLGHDVFEQQPIPGTIHLVDLEGTLRAKHAVGAHSQDIVLVPAPSIDPDDPLNWSSRRKALSTTCMCVYTLMVGISTAAIYSVLEPIAQDTSLSLNDLNAGTGYMFLLAGWGCLVWQPLALQYGKRPVYLSTILATCAIMVWAPYTRTNGQWIANKVATTLRLYSVALSMMARAGNGCSVSTKQSPMFRWAQVVLTLVDWCAIFNAIGFVFLFFFMEETNYMRHTLDNTTPTEPEIPSATGLDAEKKGPSPQPSTSTVEAGEPQPRSRKTYRDKLKLFQAADLGKKNELGRMALRPLIFLTFPVVFYAGFSYGSNLVWFNVLNATASLILGGTYNFRASMVGLSYVSPLIGVALGSAYTGWLGDRWALWMARRNGGVMEPEHRLWLFAPSVVLVPGGLVLWGVGAAEGVHWFGCVFAMGVVALTNTLGIQLSCSYAIDSYRALSGEAMVTVILVRNTMSFAIGYGITPWVDGMGLRDCFVTAGLVGLAQCLTVFAMIRWGKECRRRSIVRYAMYVEEMAASDLEHS